MATGGLIYGGSSSRRKGVLTGAGGPRRGLWCCLQPPPVLACASAAVGLLLGAWVVMSIQHLQTQVHTTMRLNHGWINSLQNSTIRFTQSSSSSSSSGSDGPAQAAAAAAGGGFNSNVQRPVNTLQLTVIQVADGSWQMQQGNAQSGGDQPSSSSSELVGSSSGGINRSTASRGNSLANGSRWEASHSSGSHESSSSSNDSSSSSSSSSSNDSSSSAGAHKEQQQTKAVEGTAKDTATIGAIPKVALLFMATNSIPNEPIWRAFFESAAQFQLQPAVATAAAAAVQETARSTVKDLLGSKPVHPPLRTFERSMYPTYKIQHGLAPGAEFPKPRPKRIYTFDELQVLLNERAMQKGISHPIVLTQKLYEKYLKAVNSTSSQPQQDQQQDQQQQHREGNSSDTEAYVAFFSTAGPWERQQLQLQVDRLLQLAPKAAAQQQQQQEPWDPLDQLSTVQDAAAVEAELQSVLDEEGATTGSSSGDTGIQQQQQPQADSFGRTLHPVLTQQQLFSVYVHTPDGVNLPEDSMFSGTELPVRLNTTRGYAQHVLAEAAVLLLKNALKDAANTKFVLVSDSSVPLYPPQVLWAQLMAERLSRLDACITPGRSTDRYRWRPVMSTHSFGQQHWRKSSQWFSLTRQAAMLAVEDRHVREVFHSFCYTNLTRGVPLCVSDEHYLASLMASYGLDNTTDCQGLAHYADWSGGGWHPKSFTPQQINPALVQQMRHGLQGRHPWDDPGLQAVRNNGNNSASNSSSSTGGNGDDECDAAAAIWSASARIFQHISASDAAAIAAQSRLLDMDASVAGDAQVAIGTALKTADSMQDLRSPAAESPGRKVLANAAAANRQDLQHFATADSSSSSSGGGGGSDDWIKAAGYVPLGPKCPLFARKFPASSVMQTLAMALSCSGLGFGSWCHQGVHSKFPVE